MVLVLALGMLLEQSLTLYRCVIIYWWEAKSHFFLFYSLFLYRSRVLAYRIFTIVKNHNQHLTEMNLFFLSFYCWLVGWLRKILMFACNFHHHHIGGFNFSFDSFFSPKVYGCWKIMRRWKKNKCPKKKNRMTIFLLRSFFWQI